MDQTFDLEAWKARMTTCVQILEGSSVLGGSEVWKFLDYSSVLGCSLLRRTKSWKGVHNPGSIRAASSVAISAGQQVRPESLATAYHSKMYGGLYYDSPLNLLYRTDLAGARLAWC